MSSLPLLADFLSFGKEGGGVGEGEGEGSEGGRRLMETDRPRK